MKQKNMPLVIGSLPCDIIYKTLQIELEEGNVVFSHNAMKHAKDRHPEDYEKYHSRLSEIIKQPDFIGDDFKNKGKIELIGRIDQEESLLIAVSISQDKNGNYHIHSFYVISEKKIQNRLANRHLKRRPLN